jgi:hypothetical protein
MLPFFILDPGFEGSGRVNMGEGAFRMRVRGKVTRVAIARLRNGNGGRLAALRRLRSSVFEESPSATCLRDDSLLVSCVAAANGGEARWGWQAGEWCLA